MTLVAAFALFALTRQLEVAQRTSVAHARVLGYDWPSSAHPLIRPARHIRFSFEVAGRTYTGFATQDWSVGQIETSKVCYDPADPTNYALVLGSASCP